MIAQAPSDARAEMQLAKPTVRSLPRGRRFFVHSAGLAVWVLAGALLPATSGFAGGVQDPMPGWETAESGNLPEYVSSRMPIAPVNLWLAGRSVASEAGDSLLRADAEQMWDSLSNRDDENDLFSRNSWLQTPTRIASRFNYLSWAMLHTGFGQFFEHDSPKYSRTNGAGVDHPRWVYLKMSFRF